MVLRKILFISATILGLFSQTGCIGGKGTVTAASAPNVVTTFKTVLDQLPKGNGSSTTPIGISSSKLSTRSVTTLGNSLSCYSSTPASPIDADSDGIALLKEYSFDCEDFADGGNVYNQKGSFKIVDKDDTVAGTQGGYRFEFNIPSWFYSSTNDNLTFGGSYVGYWDTSGTDTSTTFQSDYEGRNYGEFEIPGQGQLKMDYTFSHKWDVSYTHNSVSGNSQWTSGTMEGKGAFKIVGDFVTEKEENGTFKHEVVDGSATMTWRTENSTFDSSCTKWFKTGSHILEDVGGNIIEIKFSCSTAKVYLNNKELKDVTW